MDHDIEQAGDTAAAADPVPAEAVEKVARWLAAQAGWTNPGPWVEFKHRKFYEQEAGEALAAAAPLIAAGRATPAVVAALDEASHTIAHLRDEVARLKGAIKALDDGLAQHGEHIERLTAERDAAEAKIAAALMLLNPSVQSFSRETILKVRAALGGGTSDSPGGLR